MATAIENPVEDYRDTDENGYRSKQTYSADQSFTLAALPDVRITAAELLPTKPTQQD